MAPTLVRPPFHRPGWIYEEKVDGWRMLVYKDGARVRLISRNAVDHTARFRELAFAIAKLRPDVLVLDGAVAVFDEQLVSRFHLLGDPDPVVLCTPPMFIAFDVLQVGAHDVRSRPLESDARSWRTPSPAASWCCPFAGSSPAATAPGRPSSGAALRDSSRRIRRRPTVAALRARGNRADMHY